MKHILSDCECVSLYEAYLEGRKFIQKLNKKLTVGKLTQIKFPTDLSESLAARAILNGELLKRFGKLNCVERQSHPDILADDKRVEIKASVEGFVELTTRDLESDVLVWLDFSHLVKGEKNFINATCFYNPGNHIPKKALKVTYDAISNFYEISDNEYEIIESITFPGYSNHVSNVYSFSGHQQKLFKDDVKDEWGNLISFES